MGEIPTRPLTEVEKAILASNRSAASTFLDFLRTQRAILENEISRHERNLAMYEAMLKRGTTEGDPL